MAGHGECGVCHRRIPSNKYKRVLGTSSVWDKALAYVEKHQLELNEEDFICDRCHAAINTGKTNGIQRIKRKRTADSSISNSREHSISSQTTLDSSIDQLESMDSLELLPNDIFNEGPTNVSQDFSQASTFNSENSLDTQTSGSSLNSLLFSIPKPMITLQIPSCSGTQKRCFICGAYDRSRIPKSAILDIWVQKKIIVPVNNRSCKDHLETNGTFLSEIVEQLLPSKDSITLTADEIKDFVTLISDVPSNTFSTLLDFNENSPLTSEDYEKLTGVSKENFNDLLGYCGRLNNSVNRSKRNALAIFLMKLRLNLPQEVIGILFGISNQEKVSDAIKAVRLCLEESFVPKYLGFHHISREEAKSHQIKFANTLFQVSDEVFFVVIDATYLFIQKPSDFELQKRTYCAHKKRNLLKPMLCVFPNGYILECKGLFYCDGDNNDANILKCMLDVPTEFASFFGENDHIVVDRGFRDVIDKLKNMNYKPCMPHLMDKKIQQFSTKDSNESRFVTMIRWVVEAVNGRIKNKFRMFASVIEASYIPTLGSLFRIGCAILNAYSPAIFTENENHASLAQKALCRINQENELRSHIELKGLLRKTACWKLASKDEFQDFPKLSESHLRNVTLGTYQIHLAYLYTKKHLSNDSTYAIFVHKENSNLIRAKIESRFIKTNHQLWIRYEPNENSELGIKSWYCLCKVGSRVVGCCSHIASVIWYLGFARHNDISMRKRRSLSDNILDAAIGINNSASDIEED